MATKLTIYYDGQCPLCLAEIHFLQHHNHQNLLNFVNLHELEPLDCPINCELALKTIHAQLDGQGIITGPTVFFEAYKRTDLTVINYMFSFWVCRMIYAKFYTIFAQYRHQISRAIGPKLLKLSKRKYPDKTTTF